MKIEAGIMTLEILFNKQREDVRLVINAQTGDDLFYPQNPNVL